MLTDKARTAAKQAIETTPLGLTEFTGLKESLLMMLDSEIEYTLYRNFGKGWESYSTHLSSLEQVSYWIDLSERTHQHVNDVKYKATYRFVSPSRVLDLG